MGIHLNRALLCVLLLGIAGSPLTGAGKRLLVKEIEFRGLERLTKLELIKGVKTEAVSGGISIEISALEKSLSSNPLILSHGIEVKEKRLIIGIVEKKLLTPVLIRGNEESVLYEMDHDFKKVSRNRLYSVQGPVMVIEAKQTGRPEMSAYIKDIMVILNRLKMQRKDIYSQISEIVIKNEGRAEVIMKGRRTRFSMKPDYRNFSLLGEVTAYLDRINDYPERMKIMGQRVFFRPGRKN